MTTPSVGNKPNVITPPNVSGTSGDNQDTHGSGSPDVSGSQAGSDAIDGVDQTRIKSYLGEQDGVSDNVKNFLTNHADNVKFVDDGDLHGNDSEFKDGQIRLPLSLAKDAAKAVQAKDKGDDVDSDAQKGVSNLEQFLTHEVTRATSSGDQYKGFEVISKAVQDGNWNANTAPGLMKANHVDPKLQSNIDDAVLAIKADTGSNYSNYLAKGGGDNALYQLANGYDAYLADETSGASHIDAADRKVTDADGKPLPVKEAMQNLWDMMQKTGLKLSDPIDGNAALPSRRRGG